MHKNYKSEWKPKSSLTTPNPLIIWLRLHIQMHICTWHEVPYLIGWFVDWCLTVKGHEGWNSALSSKHIFSSYSANICLLLLIDMIF